MAETGSMVENLRNSHEPAKVRDFVFTRYARSEAAEYLGRGCSGDFTSPLPDSLQRATGGVNPPLHDFPQPARCAHTGDGRRTL